MEAEASAMATGAGSSLLASAQQGFAVQMRAKELCSVELGTRLDHMRQALPADGIQAAGDTLLASGSASVAAAGVKVRPDEVVGKEDMAAAESHLGDHEEPDVQQSASKAELWQEEQGPQSALVSGEQFGAEGEGLTYVVQVWADDESLGSGGKVWLDLHVGRQEEVLAEETLGEAEKDEVPHGPGAGRQWAEEQRIEDSFGAGDGFVQEGASCTLEYQLVEVAEEESQAGRNQPREESRKKGPAGPGHPRPSSWPQVEVLKALQLEMEPVNEQSRRAFSRLQLRNLQRRKPHLELRSSIIQHVRGFWVQAFVNHPQLSTMISDRDESMLSFLSDLKVEKGRDHCKIVLLFRSNPYFRNDLIVKEYVVTLTGYRATYSTSILWHKQYQREAYRRRHNNSSLNFFNWFSDLSLAGSGRIAEYICKDLWSNPLKYYKRRMAAVEGVEERTGQPPQPLHQLPALDSSPAQCSSDLQTQDVKAE